MYILLFDLEEKQNPLNVTTQVPPPFLAHRKLMCAL